MLLAMLIPTDWLMLTDVNRYHCLFCDGYEDRGAPSAGVLAIKDLANAKMAMHMARMAKRLSDNVTVYTDGSVDLSEEIEAAVAVTGDGNIKVERRRVVRLERAESGSGVVVHLEDGTTVTEGFLVRIFPPFFSYSFSLASFFPSP